MENTKFLIILAYYKRPVMVFNALNSIKNLQYQNWHVDFIDDSGDDSFKETLLTAGLDNSKITYIPTYDTDEIKKSVGGSRHGHFMNESIRNSDADVIVILCDDDALISDGLNKLDKFYTENPTINWSYSFVKYYNPTTGSIETATEDFQKIEKVDKKIGKLIRSHTQYFNSLWGETMRAGVEPSRLAGQIEKYACIYMSKVSDFIDYSPRTYFRPKKKTLPHE